MSPRRPVFGFLPSDSDIEAVANAVQVPPTEARLVVTPNLDHVARLRRDPSFRSAYRRASMVLCDGFPVQAYARLHAHPVRRVTGCDLVEALMQAGPPRDEQRWFFVVDGARTAASVHAWADGAWEAGAPGRVGVTVPPLAFIDDPAACEALAREIAGHGTTLLVMAVGAPQSEIFVDRHRADLPPCWAICVGQGVKVSLGLVRRAPRLLRMLRLEWSWRMWQEPRRLGRRYALGAFAFLLAVRDDLARPERLLQAEDA